MNSKRLHYLLLGVIGLLFIALIGGAYGVNSLLASRANTLTSLKAKNQALQKEQTGLATAKQEVDKYAGLQQISQAVVPEDKDQAQTVREIVKIAGDRGISLSAINFPASSLGASGPATSGTGTSAATTAPKVNTNSSTVKLSQLQRVKNIPGVYAMQITVQSDANKPVPYSSFISFLNALEHNRRTAQISAISIQPSADNPNLLTFTLTLNEYIKP